MRYGGPLEKPGHGAKRSCGWNAVFAAPRVMAGGRKKTIPEYPVEKEGR